MSKFSDIWVLKRVDVEKLAIVLWRLALVIFTMRIVLESLGTTIWLLLVPKTPAVLGASASIVAFGGVMSEATLVLQLLAVRLIVEVALRLTKVQST